MESQPDPDVESPDLSPTGLSGRTGGRIKLPSPVQTSLIEIAKPTRG